MFVALLDTSVLWPSLQRDFLLSLAIERVYRPIWSEAVLAELEYHEGRKLVSRGVSEDEAQQRAAGLIDAMRDAFPDAMVIGWEPLEGTYGLVDPDDEHVVAAAHLGGAGCIVTSNLRHFPAATLPGALEAISVADFVRDAVSFAPYRAVAALGQLAARTGRTGPVLTEADIIDILEGRYGMDEAATILRGAL